MGFEVNLRGVDVYADKEKQLLFKLSFQIEPGQFVAVLGENGAGKTSLLDLLMGFRRPMAGAVTIGSQQPWQDNWLQREEIAYLSEKVDIPGDWSARDFLDFNRFFFKGYDAQREGQLLTAFKVNPDARLGGMSAGEIRRVQIVTGLSANPKLIIIDEITAVLDIVGRRLLMKQLSFMNKHQGTTVILATNILEDLQNYITHVLVIKQGRTLGVESLETNLNGRDRHEFSQIIADRLEHS